MEFPTFLWATLVQCCFSVLAFNLNYKCAAQNTKFSAILVFGDSVVDTGNNNYLPTICRGNHSPYGTRFPGKIPTGRFSDGKLVSDILASMLGVKDAIPPYLNPNLSDQELITGVCFASACGGWDDRTFAVAGGRIPMSKQPEYLKNYTSRLTTIVGEQEARRIINEALVIIHAGGNDFLDRLNILKINQTLEDENFNSNDYGDFLLNKFQTFVEEVHNLGCRRMVVVGIPPLGCLPVTITRRSLFSRKCVDSMNSVAQSYNQKLTQLLPQIQANLPGSKFIFQDTVAPVLDMIQSPEKYGLVETDKGCCGTGLIELGPLCNQLSPVCSNSSQYLFWDAVHPSEVAHLYFAMEIFDKLPNLTST